MTDQREILYCDCHDPFHLVVFDYDPEDETLLIYQQLNHHLPWWKRLYAAYLYVTGQTVARLQYTEVFLARHDDNAKVVKIRDMLNDMLMK